MEIPEEDLEGDKEYQQKGFESTPLPVWHN